MNALDTGVPVRGERMRIPLSRGATSGFLLILLGAWGALIPFIGPYFNFAYTPGQEWTWTAARGWLEVLPGAATLVGGLLLLTSGNRVTAMLGAWLAVLAGAWFVVGRAFAGPLYLGDTGVPIASTDTMRAWLEVSYFIGLGAVIVFLGALAVGRLSVRSLRDVRHAHRSAGPAPMVAPEATQEGAEPPTAAPRHAEPQTEPVGAADETSGKPHRRGLFRRHRETAAAGR
jgi:hypothetical protein